jgi:hypothetical protein
MSEIAAKASVVTTELIKKTMTLLYKQIVNNAKKKHKPIKTYFV